MSNHAPLGELPNTSDEAFVVLSNLAESVTGLTDLGYKHARTREAASALAIRAAEMIPNFPEEVSDEDKGRVFEGYRLRKGELVGTRYYRIEGEDTYNLSTHEAYLAHGSEVGTFLVLDVDYAFSYTQQEFGALKKKQPNKHALLKAVRDETNKYCSGAWGALVAAYKALTKEPRSRENNKSYYDYLDETFKAIEARAKTARNREGAANVPSDSAVKKAIAAFYKALG